MSWLFGSSEPFVKSGGEGAPPSPRKAAPTQKPVGGGTPIPCAECGAGSNAVDCKHAIRTKKQAAVAAPVPGVPGCLVCGCETTKCICSNVWGEREKEIRSKLSRATLLQGMCKFLSDVRKLETFEGSAIELCATLGEHGAVLQQQETLLVSHSGGGVLSQESVENHNKAVAAWLAVCDEHIASMLLHDVNIQFLRKLSKQRTWPLPSSQASSSSGGGEGQ